MSGVGVIRGRLDAGRPEKSKELGDILYGIDDESRVWWHVEGGRAIVSTEPPVPNEVASAEEFWDGVNEALKDAAAGRVRDATLVSGELRERS